MFNFKPIVESCSTGGDDCCSPRPKGEGICPKCHEKAKGVLTKTLEHLLQDDTKERVGDLNGFYYCKTPSCEAVYFKGNLVLQQDDVKVTVGLKDGAKSATLCYCFGWTKDMIRDELRKTGKTTALEDIKKKMKDPGCSCEVKNPSGGCCLADNKKAIEEIKIELALA